MDIALIVLGVLCLMLVINSPVYLVLGAGFVAWGLVLRDKKVKKKRREQNPPGGEGYSGRVHLGSNSDFVYDRDGNLHNVSSWNESVNGGTYFDPHSDLRAERDSNGDLHIR